MTAIETCLLLISIATLDHITAHSVDFYVLCCVDCNLYKRVNIDIIMELKIINYVSCIYL